MLTTWAALLGITVGYLFWRRRRSVGARARAIDSFIFPSSIAAKVREAYPHLSAAQAATVMDPVLSRFLHGRWAHGVHAKQGGGHGLA